MSKRAPAVAAGWPRRLASLIWRRAPKPAPVVTIVRTVHSPSPATPGVLREHRHSHTELVREIRAERSHAPAGGPASGLWSARAVMAPPGSFALRLPEPERRLAPGQPTSAAPTPTRLMLARRTRLGPRGGTSPLPALAATRSEDTVRAARRAPMLARPPGRKPIHASLAPPPGLPMRATPSPATGMDVWSARAALVAPGLAPSAAPPRLAWREAELVARPLPALRRPVPAPRRIHSASPAMVWRAPRSTPGPALASPVSPAPAAAMPSAAGQAVDSPFLPGAAAPATALDPGVAERLAQDVMRRIERNLRIERERRGL